MKAKELAEFLLKTPDYIIRVYNPFDEEWVDFDVTLDISVEDISRTILIDG